MPRDITRRLFGRCLCFGLSMFAVVAGAPSLSLADWREDVGYNDLVAILGDDLPNGAGVPISLVEAMEPGSSANSPEYFPDENFSDFRAVADPFSTAVNFIDGSGGQANGTSIHATDQARNFFGNNLSVAPAANEVTVYEANDYLTDVLNLNNSNVDEPDPQNFRVQNFSWVGSFATPLDGTPEPTTAELNNDREALRRFDFVINRDNITAFVGLNNGTNPMPHLLGHSYNAIAVGRSDGFHSTGLTRLADYGVGRSKPDIVLPQTSASAATSSMSSIATFLHSSDTVLGTDAANSQTMKAILLAGATKDTLPSWSQVDGDGEWRPLDDTYGAGEASIYNSYAITVGGPITGTTGVAAPVSRHGWDYQTVQPGAGNEIMYDFVIPDGSTAAELSIALTWNAEISAPFHTGDPVLADLNLELVDSSGMTIDTNLGDTYVDGLSAGEIDNVEHIYLTNLAAGTYTLKVSSDDLAADFGLAWRTATQFDTFSADFNEDGSISGADFLAWQRGYGKLVNAGRADGDSNGDGDVDADDLAFLHSELAAVNPALAAALFAVPEPSTLAIATGGLMLMLVRRYRDNWSSASRP